MKYAAMILLLMTTAALADGEGGVWKEWKWPPQELKTHKPITEEEISKLQPSEENKKWFLERGYKLNGNKMCCGFIDVDQPKSWTDDAKQIKTVPIMPVAKPEEFNEIDAQANVDWEARRKFMHRTFQATHEQLAGDVCQQHNMRKVTTADGKSWRCRK